MSISSREVLFRGVDFLFVFMERKKYRWCAVPQCTNTSKSTPNKIFIDVPRKADIRKKWLDLARRKCDGMSVTSPIYFCEDHFVLPNDMENYMRYHVMGTVDRVMLKRGCLPTKFQCQSDRKRSLPSTVTSRPAAIKRQRLALVQEALDDSKLESDTKEVNTTLSPSSPVEVIVEHQPKNQDKGVQVFVKSTYFRSKSTGTEFKSHSIATSPFKIWTLTVSTSPFKVEHVKVAMPSASKIHRKLLVDGSDSDTSLCSQSIFQQSSPSVQSLQLKSLSESSSLDEEEAILEKNREVKQALDNICKKIEAKPRLYIGITNNCYFLLNLIEKNTNIPIVNILLCLKKIRLNTTFSELSDQFGISRSYAGKIFRKCIPIISDVLKSFIVKLDKKKIKTALPIAFRHRYNKVNCIIDCFEIEIEKPSKSVHQALTWSEYKKGNTIKYLISSTPNGLVNYISSGYGGRISDTLLVENCEFLDQLEPGSWVLADRGFKHIEQLLIQKKCHLLRPPSVIQGAKLSKKEAHQTKQIASLRIHIERVIRRIREFSLLKPHSVLNSKLPDVNIVRQENRIEDNNMNPVLCDGVKEDERRAATLRAQPQLYSCDKCMKTYASKDSLMQHYRNLHSTESHKCTKCSKIFQSKSYLYNHTRNAHSKQQYECAVCKKIYKWKSALNKHVYKVHRPTGSEPKIYTCIYCQKTFTDKGILTVHVNHVHASGSYKCSQCNKGFKCEQYLMTHTTRNHTAGSHQLHACTNCGQYFLTKQYCQRHEKIGKCTRPTASNESAVASTSRQQRNVVIVKEEPADGELELGPTVFQHMDCNYRPYKQEPQLD